MTDHPEKKLVTVTFRTTQRVVDALPGLAELCDTSQSSLLHALVESYLDKKEREARVLINALKIKDL